MNENNRKLSITADSGANLKLLRTLERQGFITITTVNLENGKHNRVNNKVGPVMVWESLTGETGAYGEVEIVNIKRY